MPQKKRETPDGPWNMEVGLPWIKLFETVSRRHFFDYPWETAATMSTRKSRDVNPAKLDAEHGYQGDLPQPQHYSRNT